MNEARAQRMLTLNRTQRMLTLNRAQRMLTRDSQVGEDEGGRLEGVHTGDCFGIDLTRLCELPVVPPPKVTEVRTEVRDRDWGKLERAGSGFLSVYRYGPDGAPQTAVPLRLSTLCPGRIIDVTPEAKWVGISASEKFATLYKALVG